MYSQEHMMVRREYFLPSCAPGTLDGIYGLVVPWHTHMKPYYNCIDLTTHEQNSDSDLSGEKISAILQQDMAYWIKI